VSEIVKAIYVIRTDLPMSRAKLGVQIGHGTDFIHMRSSEIPHYRDWIDPQKGNRRKIVCRISSLDELKKLEAKLTEDDIPFAPIVDAGYTEFNGETQSGTVIFPLAEDFSPKYLKRLQTLKDE
jgi:peptidyl-tRNA hydrolase